VNAGFAYGTCQQCQKHGLLIPLHGERGGASMCQVCAGEWHAKYGRKRQRGSVVIRAIKAFLAEGGEDEEVRKLMLEASAGELLDIGPIGYMAGAVKEDDTVIEMTSELLDDTLRLAHPDSHPPERYELANAVTRALLALKPFVFPAAKPAVKPKPVAAASGDDDASGADDASGDDDASGADDDANSYFQKTSDLLKKALAYPCPECRSMPPVFYCDACKAEYQLRKERERARYNAKQRKLYARRTQRGALLEATCAECEKPFKAKRKDARFCCNACRQRAHQHGRSAVKTAKLDRTDWLVSRIIELFREEPDGAFTVEELCERVQSNTPIGKPNMLRAVKALKQRGYDDRSLRPGLGFLRSWERGGEYVVFDRYNIRSYTAAHLEIGLEFGDRYYSTAELIEEYGDEARRGERDYYDYEKLSAPGGRWHRDVVYWIAKRDGDKATMSACAAHFNKDRAYWGQPPLPDDAFA
jgi:hypothetical protein